MGNKKKRPATPPGSPDNTPVETPPDQPKEIPIKEPKTPDKKKKRLHPNYWVQDNLWPFF